MKKEMQMPVGPVGYKGVGSVVNLRPDVSVRGNTILRPIALSEGQVLPAGWKVLAEIDHNFLLAKGNEVALTDGDLVLPADSELPGEALCAIPSGDRMMVMCVGGAAYVDISSGSPVVSEAWKDYPALGLRGADSAEVSAAVDSRTLSRAYSTGLFDKKDRDALIGDLSGAYCQLCVLAAASGLMIQPALARYRLLDRRGDELFVSPPVLLMHSTGAQCCGTLSLTSADRQTVDAYTLRASTWYPTVNIPAYEDTEVALAEILMTPLFHPYDTTLAGTAHLGRAGSSTSVFATVGLPGRERGLGRTFEGNASRIIMDAIAHMEQLEKRVAVIANPFDGRQRTVRPSISIEPDPTADMSRMRSILASAVTSRPYADTMLCRPHRFSAACVAESSGAVAWGNLKALRYQGFPLDTFTAGDIADSRRSIAVVKFTDGTGVIRSETCTDVPVQLGPLICYPAPDAAEITVTSYYGGVNHSRTFPLVPDASGRYSVYVSDVTGYITLPECSPTVTVDVEEGDIAFADMIAYAPVSRPLDIMAVQSTGSSVVSLAGRSGSDQSWDFGRSRFSVGCRSAIFSTGVNLNTGGTGMRTILGRGVVRSDAIAVGCDGEVYVAGAGIMLLPRSGSHVRISDRDIYVAVGYDRSRDELWALRSDGGADVFCRRFDWGYYSVEGVAFDMFMQSGALYLCRDRRIIAVDDSPPEAVDISLSVEGSVDRRCRFFPVRRVHVAAQGSLFNGRIDIEGTGVANMRPWLMRRARVNGTLAGPLAIDVEGRMARAVRVTIDARVSSDFVIDTIVIR